MFIFTRDSEDDNARSVESNSETLVLEGGGESASVSLDYSGPSGFAKSHLEHVSERLQNKLQALTVSKLFIFLAPHCRSSLNM